MAFIKYVGSAMILGLIIYYLVDDKTRNIFDNGMEKQSIEIVEMKKNIYLFFYELGGADKKQRAAESAVFDAEINLRKNRLEEKMRAQEENRLPAEDEAENYDRLFSE